MRVLQGAIAIALLTVGTHTEPVSRAAKAPKVDLGYAVYEGSYDANSSINVFKGQGAILHSVIDFEN